MPRSVALLVAGIINKQNTEPITEKILIKYCILNFVPKIKRIISDIVPITEILKNSLGNISLRNILIDLWSKFLNTDGAITDVWNNIKPDINPEHIA